MNLCVCVSFFYTARLNMNMFQSTAKQWGETGREEIYQPPIETFLKDNSMDTMYLSSPLVLLPL